MKKIYCVVVDSVRDYEESITIVAAFTKLEPALERMRNEWEQFLEEDVADIMDERKEGRMHCDAWEDGWSSHYHHYIMVKEVDLHK